MPAVEVDDLVVRYGDLVAVDHVSFCAEAGAITAVLGPNGAGKTSTIEVCEGYRSATSGSTTVLGMNPQTEQTKLSKRMGVMLQEGGVSLGARVGDIVRLYCDLYGKGVSPSALLESVGLGERIRSSYRRLSGGEKQRLSLALALAARPDVAFLDEPTSGVDITGRQLIRGIVRELADQGCAVVLATHELDEAERVADHVVIFDRGRIIADGTLDDLRRGHDEIRFRTSPTLALSELSTALGLPVRALGDGEFVIDGDAQHVGALTTWLAQHNEPLADLRAGRQRLEDVFLRLTGGAS
ncbi:MAG: ABC transporter ATP-binding protein [Actinobacteria bacterium]|nr:ABC transporter ATP-binding protein [Actinomycetota bacterium]